MTRGKASPLSILFLLTVGSVFSQEAEENMVLRDASPVDMGAASAPSTFFVILRVLLVLALAAGAIYGLVFLIKKFGRAPEPRDPFLKVLAGVSLGANRFVHIIGVNEKAWLVGSADGGVSLIAEILDKETLDALFLEDSKREAERVKPVGFAQFMRRMVKAEVPVEEPPKAENVRKTRERLRGL